MKPVQSIVRTNLALFGILSIGLWASSQSNGVVEARGYIW